MAPPAVRAQVDTIGTAALGLFSALRFPGIGLLFGADGIDASIHRKVHVDAAEVTELRVAHANAGDARLRFEWLGLDAGEAVRGALPAIRENLPRDVRLELAVDRSIFVQASLVEVGKTLGIAFAIVVLVNLFFLRSKTTPSIAAVISGAAGSTRHPGSAPLSCAGCA